MSGSLENVNNNSRQHMPSLVLVLLVGNGMTGKRWRKEREEMRQNSPWTEVRNRVTNQLINVFVTR